MYLIACRLFTLCALWSASPRAHYCYCYYYNKTFFITWVTPTTKTNKPNANYTKCIKRLHVFIKTLAFNFVHFSKIEFCLSIFFIFFCSLTLSLALYIPFPFALCFCLSRSQSHRIYVVVCTCLSLFQPKMCMSKYTRSHSFYPFFARTLLRVVYACWDNSTRLKLCKWKRIKWKEKLSTQTTTNKRHHCAVAISLPPPRLTIKRHTNKPTHSHAHARTLEFSQNRTNVNNWQDSQWITQISNSKWIYK